MTQSFFEYLNGLLFGLAEPLPLVLVIAAMCVLGFAAFRRKHLTGPGAAAAAVLGTVVLWCLRFEGFFIFCVFYVTSNLAGKYSRKHRGEDRVAKKGARRDWLQVLANGALASVASLFWYMTGSVSALVMFGAVMAEASADTWAGEIGRLSSKPPVSIRDFRPVEPGMSGGITALGLMAGFSASAVISVFQALLFPVKNSILCAAVVCLAGFAGCVADSLLGAFVQVMYEDPVTGKLTEHDRDSAGNPLKPVRGLRWMTNDTVNFVSNLFSGVLALGMCRVFLQQNFY